MDQIHQAREMFFSQDKTLAEIARLMNCDWRTVRKYVDMEDFNEKQPAKRTELTKLDPFKSVIDSWLSGDKKAPRKQRHSALRVYNRLKDEIGGFNCSYRTVATYVAKRKEELRQEQLNRGYIPLIHHPGEAQADFGYADFYENGILHKEAKYLVVSFPYSNGGYLQLCYGENLECLLEGLVAIFNHIGGVPTEIWFDNTRTIVTNIIKGGGRTVNEKFQRFCEHFRFKALFMNAHAGNEKGNVENKVGYLRRNTLVPIPSFHDLTEKNQELLARCDEDMEREHYDDSEHRYISELFQEDKAVLLPLPSIPFDVSRYETVQTDKYGKFTLDKGKHRYSVSPAFSGKTVRLEITASEIIVMDTEEHEIIRHRRLYGDKYESMNWLPYLKFIACKPRSLRNSGIFEMMPVNLQKYLTDCASGERGKVLKILAGLTEMSGWDHALEAVDEALKYNAADPDSLQNFYRRIYDDVPQLPPLEKNDIMPFQQPIPFRNDLETLDAILTERGA
jgi:transposase